MSSGLSHQVWVMNANQRCSIFFHLMAPGGEMTDGDLELASLDAVLKLPLQ